jgi:peptidoglycan hydrolase-like protein with peptidoglycan-binding domain
MSLHKKTHLALSLLLAAWLGVFAGAAAQAQSPSPNKSFNSKSRTGVHKKRTARKSRRRERGQKTPTADRITEIQQALAKDGSYAGTPSGKWDDSTVEATKKFQESHGLTPTGKLDAKTLQQLGLGSDTAGAAAPLPSTSTSRLTPPSTQAAQRPN